MTALRTLLAPALLALAVQACATSNPGRFETAHVADLSRGTVDRAQVAAWFGEPADVERADNPAPRGACVESWHWSNATRQTWQNLTVYFDERGVVCDHVFSGPPRAHRTADPRLGTRRL